MPEQAASRRGSGGSTLAGLTVYGGRYYQADTLGGVCEACGQLIPAALAGITTHPTCDPEWAALLVSLRRALKRRAR